MKLSLKNNIQKKQIKLFIRGDILAPNIRRIRKVLQKFIFDKDIRRVKVDFRKVNNIDAMGAIEFLRAGELAEKEKTKLELINMKGHIYDFFTRHGFKAIYETIKIPKYSKEIIEAT